MWHHEQEVEYAAFSPDGRRVVTASRDSTARVWDAVTGEPVTGPLRHTHIVWKAVFSPDGNRVVTASHDGTARVWDAHSGQSITRALPHRFQVMDASFSPDGGRVVTGSTDGSAQAGIEASKGSSRRSAGVISRASAGALNSMQEMIAASHFIRMLHQVFRPCIRDHVGDARQGQDPRQDPRPV